MNKHGLEYDTLLASEETKLNQNQYFISVISKLVGLGFAISACAGEVPNGASPNGTPPADTDAGAGGEPGAILQSVSGTVVDYFAAGVGTIAPVGGASLVSDGLVPATTSMANALGEYSMEVAASSFFYLTVSAEGYASSRNSEINMADGMAETRILYAASNAGIEQQFVSAGGEAPVAKLPNTGCIMVELARNNGQPALGVSVDDIVLTAVATPEVPVSSVYFAAPVAGDPQTADLLPNDIAPLSVDDGQGRSRAGFLNIPPGEYELTVTIPGAGNGKGGIQTVQAMVIADGVTFIYSADGRVDDGGNGNGNGGNGNGNGNDAGPIGGGVDAGPIGGGVDAGPIGGGVDAGPIGGGVDAGPIGGGVDAGPIGGGVDAGPIGGGVDAGPIGGNNGNNGNNGADAGV